MKRLGRLFGVLAGLALPVTLLAAIEPNNWQAVDGVLDGEWSDEGTVLQCKAKAGLCLILK